MSVLKPCARQPAQHDARSRTERKVNTAQQRLGGQMQQRAAVSSDGVAERCQGKDCSDHWHAGGLSECAHE